MQAAITTPRAVVTGGVAWITIALILGVTGILAAVPTPGPQLLILALTGATIWVTSRGALRSFVDSIPIRGLVAIHAGRFVGAVFLAMSAQGTLSPLFATRAGWGDIAAAAGALAVLSIGAPTTKLRRGLYLGWNIFAVADLVVAVATASIVALRGDIPGIAALFSAPLILVPTFFVPILFASHVLIFRRLRRSTDVS